MNKKKVAYKAVELIIKCKPKEFQELNVNKVAELLDISVPHLSREFKEKMNINLHEYILREKIKRSCFLLKQNESMTIKEVSKIFDLSSCNYFIKIFKKYVGITPGEFRKIDNGFFGLCDRREGPIDYRAEIGDRRSNSSYGKLRFALSADTSSRVPVDKERRHRMMDRRKCSCDRRQIIKQNKSKL